MVTKKATKLAVDFDEYIANRTAADNALAEIRTIRGSAKEAKEYLAENEDAARAELKEGGGRLVISNSLLEFTKGGQIRITAVAVA
jgi:hypothetical protein